MEGSGTNATCYILELNYTVTSTTPVKEQAMEERGADITFGCLRKLLAAAVFLNW